MPEIFATRNFSNSGTKHEVRMRVVLEFATEPAGLGTGDLASRYTYYVETLSDGNRIYLRRPANLHNGFDFLVCVENYLFNGPGEKRRNYPKHENIINDLIIKKNSEPERYRDLFTLIERVYLCNDVSDDELSAVRFQGNGYLSDMIVKTLKWLFIEQDIRYWSYSGRIMLWESIPRP